ncbi:NAD(P)-dependent alcohol dehydrogenase [Catenulispora subtropica]|uniref:NAD(P)-dependent alcohol dehydrogenase n=1 Tax=Catenulispora subtropica TaxID=450798 RepID=A0ABP5DJ15_9ACTN
MRAFTRHRFGDPGVLELVDSETPTPAEGEVLVRVHATSVNPYDWHHLRGEPMLARLVPGGLGLTRPRLRRLGCDLAGRVEAVGDGVTRFAPGDDVYALLEEGGFAEYACVPQDQLVPMPRNLTHEQAATVPMAAATALLALRDDGRIEAGQDVIITGASGGVGTYAVQIAVALGAKVTAVCGARNLDLVRSLGAAHAVDHAAGDVTRGPRHDLAVDLAGRTSTRAWRRALHPEGTLVVVGGPPGRWFQPMTHVLASVAVAPLGKQRVVGTDIVGHRRKPELLTTLTTLIEDGEVTPVIDRSYAFEELPEAIRHQERGHARGKVVVSIGG